MDINEILEKVEQIFIDFFEDETIQLNFETTANDIEDWDSLTHIQLIMEVEKKFSIKFNLIEVQNFKNVGELCDNILNKIQ